MTKHRRKTLHWVVKEITTQKKHKNNTMNGKKRKTTAVKFALSLITGWRESFCSSGGRKTFRNCPPNKKKNEKMTEEEEEKEMKNSMNKKENEIPPSPHSFGMTNLPRRLPKKLLPRLIFAAFQGRSFLKRISSPHVRFLSPRGTRVQEPTRARVRWSWLASSWLVVLATDRLLVLFWLQIPPATTSNTRDVADSMEEIVLWFWPLAEPRLFKTVFRSCFAFCSF